MDLDRLIKTYFNTGSSSDTIDSLERDVWSKIREKEKYSSFDLFYSSLWNSSQLKYASIALAFVVVGVLLQIPQELVQYDSLGLGVFSSDSPYLISSTINLAGLHS